jgi:hypothetical protein
MSDLSREIDISAWVDKAKNNPIGYQQRQTIEITLTAISIAVELNEKLFLKGGILMGLAYDSPRQTTDIDLTSAFAADENMESHVADLLDRALPRAAAILGYTNLLIKVQSSKRQPPGELSALSFPALKIKVGFAEKGSRQEVALKNGKASGVIEIDISFNETITHTQMLLLPDGRSIWAYGLTDLIAEKYRAMMQQKTRSRNGRRQDTYDLHFLIMRIHFTDEAREKLLKAIIKKCASRGIEATQISLDDQEIRNKSSSEWQTMELEITELPNFDDCYDVANAFYKSLPWEAQAKISL